MKIVSDSRRKRECPLGRKHGPNRTETSGLSGRERVRPCMKGLLFSLSPYFINIQSLLDARATYVAARPGKCSPLFARQRTELKVAQQRAAGEAEGEAEGEGVSWMKKNNAKKKPQTLTSYLSPAMQN